MIDTLNIAELSDQVRDLKLNGTGGSDLPEVDETDEGKVLMVGSTGEWEADDLPPQLPEVDQSDYGAYLMVDENGEWGLGSPSSGTYEAIAGSSVATGNKIMTYNEYIYTAQTPPTEFQTLNVGNTVHGLIEVKANQVINPDGLGNKLTTIDLTSKFILNGTSDNTFVWATGAYVTNLTNLYIRYF